MHILQAGIGVIALMLIAGSAFFYVTMRDSDMPMESSDSSEAEISSGTEHASTTNTAGQQSGDSPTVRIGDAHIHVEIADSLLERIQGLSGRQHLPEHTGMLFVFDEPGRHGIWMKDMHFAIDIIWIGENNRVVDRQIDARPESFPESFKPRSEALYVLEVNSGFVEEHEIEIGDVVAIE
jgi:uncharacterized membrane protein (UPF0127 family)